MTQPDYNKPKIIREFGIGVLFVGIVFLLLGLYL